MVRKLRLLGVLACGALLVGAPACDRNNKGGEKPAPATSAESAPAPSPTIAVVNGEDVPAQGFLDMTRRLPPVTRQGLLEPEKRRALLDDFLSEKLLYQEALHRGLDKDPETARRIRDYAERVIVQALRREIQRVPIDQAVIEKFYQDNIEEYTQERSRFSMILKRRPPNRTPEDDKRLEKQIKAIYKKLRGGADFAKLATKESDDPRSKRAGGDLGYVGLERWSSQVAEAGDRLKVGEVGEPLQVGYGWIILKRTSEAKVMQVPLNEVKARIAQRIRIENLDRFKEELRQKASIEVKDDVLASLDFGAGLRRPQAPPARKAAKARPAGGGQ